jgi:hypothetical protein
LGGAVTGGIDELFISFQERPHDGRALDEVATRRSEKYTLGC